MAREKDTIVASRSSLNGVAWSALIAALKSEAKHHPELMAERINRETEGDPFRLLVAIMLSARARDEVTESIAGDLFRRAKTPSGILAIPLRELENVLRSVGTYRQKAKNLRATCRMLLDEFDGSVPETVDQLVQLPGVGRKTANLVLIRAFNKPAISVDTHVHRLSNAFGIVKTKTPEQTEKALRSMLPRRYWKEWNRLLVTWGKYVCPRDASICLATLNEKVNRR